MAKTDFNVLGRQSGKIGNVVGLVRAGHQLYRAYTNKQTTKETEEQAKVRSHFSFLGSMALAFATAIRKGFKALTKGTLQTAENIFVKKNWGAVTVSDPESPSCDYGSLVIAQGRAPWPEFGTPSFVEEGEVSVTFSATGYAGQTENDKVYIFVYQPDTNTGILSNPTALSTGSLTVEVPTVWSGMKVHVYGFAVSAYNGEDPDLPLQAGDVSQSVYVGQGTLA